MIGSLVDPLACEVLSIVVNAASLQHAPAGAARARRHEARGASMRTRGARHCAPLLGRRSRVSNSPDWAWRATKPHPPAPAGAIVPGAARTADGEVSHAVHLIGDLGLDSGELRFFS